MRRHSFTTLDITRDILATLSLPSVPLSLPGADQPAFRSSFKIGAIAQSTIAASACAASLFYSRRASVTAPQVTVPLHHAAVEFQSERLYSLHHEQKQELPWGRIGGLHKTKDGYVRIHDSLENHTTATLRLLGLPATAKKDDVAAEVAKWNGEDLENATVDKGVVIYKLRSFEEYDAIHSSTTQPVRIRLATASPPKLLPGLVHKRCLDGIKVVEMTRVIAGPVAGRTLAHHGAKVAWITSPNLPDLPALDVDFSRGKKRKYLDIKTPNGKLELLDMLKDADVFIQSYRPGALASQGLSIQELQKINPNIICANLSAFGDGPWSNRRGFDSLVQTASGMNVSEAEHAGLGQDARAAPCQVLDHASGYLLASGIIAALNHRESQGGSWEVNVSLSGTMDYLRSLSQYPGGSGFETPEVPISENFVEDLPNGKFVKHAASIEGIQIATHYGGIS